MSVMWHQEIKYDDPLLLFQPFSAEQGAILLHSAKKMPGLGRYSYFVVDPFRQLRIETDSELDAFFELAKLLSQFYLNPIEDLPPFQGGALGFLSYELLQQLERVPRSERDEQTFPLLMFGFYDLVVAFDHEQQRAWLISSGWPETNAESRLARAKARGEWLLARLAPPSTAIDYGNAVVDSSQISANFTKSEYLTTIARTIDYILAGDIFEANITQRFSAILPDQLSAWQLFTRSCAVNGATFASYVNFGDVQLASASPERFIKVERGRVECRPIKGTAPRSADPIEDQRLAEQLCASDKDRAENIMIVDLMRNDIARVCEVESVQVTQLCGFESYATVHHLVSVVEGRLSEPTTLVDLLRATFPGGSITGAPKIRSMEIIAELEPDVRGPYCGNVVALGFDGFMDSSIIIRTFAIAKGKVTFHAGGAIVADSDPEGEYQESLAKAAPLRHVLTHCVGDEAGGLKARSKREVEL